MGRVRLGSLGQGDCKFEGSLVYILRSCLSEEEKERERETEYELDEFDLNRLVLQTELDHLNMIGNSALMFLV